VEDALVPWAVSRFRFFDLMVVEDLVVVVVVGSEVDSAGASGKGSIAGRSGCG